MSFHDAVKSARSGDRVAFFVNQLTEVEHLLDSVEDEMFKKFRTSGQQRILHSSGGYIRFFSLRSLCSIRGMSFDVVYAPAQSLTESAFLREVSPALTTTNGVIREL